jgi:hypothetical protein
MHLLNILNRIFKGSRVARPSWLRYWLWLFLNINSSSSKHVFKKISNDFMFEKKEVKIRSSQNKSHPPKKQRKKNTTCEILPTCQQYWHSQSFENIHFCKITHMIEAAFLSIPIQTVSFNLFARLFCSFLFFKYLRLHSLWLFIHSLPFSIILSEFSLFSFCSDTKWVKKIPKNLGKHTRNGKKTKLWTEYISMRC